MKRFILLLLVLTLTLAMSPAPGSAATATAGPCTLEFCNQCPPGTICVERGSGTGTFCLCKTTSA